MEKLIDECGIPKACWNCQPEPCNQCDTIDNIFQRLKEYEDTELTPNEIQGLVRGCELYTKNENFIQNKFGYCFYSLGPCPLIYNLYVHSQYRRCGNSKRLLELAINEIRKIGYNGKIYIQAKPIENSIDLNNLKKYYERMGLIVFENQEEIQND